MRTKLLLVPLTAAALVTPSWVPAVAAGVCYNQDATIVAAPGGGPLSGTPDDDVILGSDGVDTIDGLGGTDIICGAGGDDVIEVGEGFGGFVFGGEGDDQITVHASSGYAGGEGGNDTLLSEAKGVLLDGDDGADDLAGSDFPERLDGGPGEDELRAYGGHDLADGGDDADAVHGGPGNDVLHGDGGNDVVGSGSGVGDEVWGDAGHDDLSGEATGAEVLGGDGDDRLVASKKGVLLKGEDGNDTLVGSKYVDKMHGGPGNDNLDAGAGDDATFNGAEIHGNGGNDTITGGLGEDQVYGDAGNDTLDTGGGAQGDNAFGGTDDDRIKVTTPFGAGLGEEGDDVLVSTADAVLLDGGPGADVLTGGKKRDRLDGEGGDDTLKGGAGVDDIRGGDGNDTVAAGGGDDKVTGGPGIDGLEGGAGTDVLAGGDANDALNGQGGDDQLRGEGGHDHCSGGPGRDMCDGGAPGPPKPSPSDPDVCDSTVELKKSCRKPGAAQPPASYTGTSTGTVVNDTCCDDEANVTQTWSATYTYELNQELSHPPSQWYVYDLTDYDVEWEAHGRSGSPVCTIDAPLQHFDPAGAEDPGDSFPNPPAQGGISFDLSQDTYSFRFEMGRHNEYALMSCPPQAGGVRDSLWQVQVGGQTGFLPLDLTKPIDGEVTEELNGDLVSWDYTLAPGG